MPTMRYSLEVASKYTAWQLLDCSISDLVDYIKYSLDPVHGFDILGVSGLGVLPVPRQRVLIGKLRVAAKKWESKYEAATTRLNKLLGRLDIAATGQHVPSEDTIPATPNYPSEYKNYRLEELCLKELIQNRGMPVSSHVSWLDARERERLPWMEWFSSTEPTVLSKQLDRWWEFIKWQIDCRGSTVEEHGEYGFSAYLAAQKRRHSVLSDEELYPAFDKTVEEEWMKKTKYTGNPRDASLPAYEEAVKQRLALHNFTQEFQLKADPRQQDLWTTLVEYLDFEYQEADRLAALLKISKPHNDKAWRHFDPIDPLDTSQSPFITKLDDMSLEALQQRVRDFLIGTETYRRDKELARRQGILTQWVLERVHFVEAEYKRQRKAEEAEEAEEEEERNALADKKRSRTEDEEAEAKEGGCDLKRQRQGDAASEDSEDTVQ